MKTEDEFHSTAIPVACSENVIVLGIYCHFQ